MKPQADAGYQLILGPFALVTQHWVTVVIVVAVSIALHKSKAWQKLVVMTRSCTNTSFREQPNTPKHTSFHSKSHITPKVYSQTQPNSLKSKHINTPKLSNSLTHQYTQTYILSWHARTAIVQTEKLQCSCCPDGFFRSFLQVASFW